MYIEYITYSFSTTIRSHVYDSWNDICHNRNLRLATKVKACKGVGQEWSLGITFHAPGGVGKCEGMNPHTPKLAPTLGIGVQMNSCVATLALGSQPRQGLARVWAKKEPRSHISCSWECRTVREWTFTLPSELPLWELES